MPKTLGHEGRASVGRDRYCAEASDWSSSITFVSPLGLADGEAKFWLEPEIELAQNYGLSRHRITAALELIRRHQDEIRTTWHAHFGP